MHSTKLLHSRQFRPNVPVRPGGGSSSGNGSGRNSSGSGRQVRVLTRAAQKGFGKSSNKKQMDIEGSGMVLPKEGKRVKSLAAELNDEKGSSSSSKAAAAADGAPAGFPKDWVDLKAKAGDIPIGKNTKPLILASGKALMLYKFENLVYVSDAESSAYKYPMTDARVFRDSETGRPAAEVPLDGTVYDLATGAVLKWCPKDNPVRSLLGTLKSKTDPTPLKVYPVHVTKDGALFTKLL